IASPRSAAASSLTRLPPSRISPALGFSRPAMMRSSVDLPQPDGPTRTTNSPSATSRSTAWITSTGPNDFDTWRRLRSVIARSFKARRGDARGDEALQEGEDDHHGEHADDRHGEDVVPLHVQLAGEGAEADLQRVELLAGEHDQRPQEIVP